MKRFLLWLISVALGVVVLLAAVMGVSYAFTTQGGCPDAAAQFGGQELETNGYCWQVPLLGGKLDKVFASPATLTVQKLGTLYTAHPAITLPDWASYTTLTIQNAYGSIVFVGSVSDYQSFLFPANGEYKAELSVWRVPEGGMATQFEGGSTGAVRRNLGLEKPAKPTDLPFTDLTQDWYMDSIRYVYEHELMYGTTDTTFAPDDALTRGMFVTMLYRMEGKPEATGNTSFTDVPANMYYAPAIAWASANGVVYGTSETAFSPEGKITREQMAVILKNYAAKPMRQLKPLAKKLSIYMNLPIWSSTEKNNEIAEFHKQPGRSSQTAMF